MQKEGTVVTQTRIIGKYRIIRKLGTGGEGSVWLAVHMQTHKLRALKEFRLSRENSHDEMECSRDANPKEELHELSMLRRIRHSALPDIIDVLETDESMFLVMEYIRGKNLEELIRERGSLPAGQVLLIAIHLCGALAYLHSRPQKILHLDVKPANIILTKGGRLVLVDFGAALFQKDTVSAKRKGTDGFASPEQYRQDVTLDGRSDIYSLGAVLYLLLTGSRYLPSAGKCRIAGCPEGLECILYKCLQEDREKRYGTCSELKMELTVFRNKCIRQRRRTGIWAAFLIAVLAMTFAYYGIRGQLTQHVTESFDYHRLLSEASLSSRQQAMEYYFQAVYMAPTQKEAYLQLIGEMDRDGCFDRQEEEQLRTLLHSIPYGSDKTYEELLRQNPSAYGEVSCRIGLMYRFEYVQDEAAGKRIAAGWFERSLAQTEMADMQKEETITQERVTEAPEGVTGPQKEAGERQDGTAGEQTDWAVLAEIFAGLSNTDDSGTAQLFSGQNTAAAYYEGVRQLIESDLPGQLNPAQREKLCVEALTRIAGSMHRMTEGGVSPDELKEMIDKLELTGCGAQAEKTEDLTAAPSMEGGSDTQEKQPADEIRALSAQCRQLLENLTTSNESEAL